VQLGAVVAAAIRQTFLKAGAGAAHQTWRHVADQLRGRWPKLAALMDDIKHYVLAYMAFPAQPLCADPLGRAMTADAKPRRLRLLPR
jgi:hypothetical protein